jgi:hypothetical protein
MKTILNLLTTYSGELILTAIAAVVRKIEIAYLKRKNRIK